jgi:hypothetical protein
MTEDEIKTRSKNQEEQYYIRRACDCNWYFLGLSSALVAQL